MTIAAKPNPELKVSEISHIAGAKGGKQYQITQLAQSKEEYNGTESFVALSFNPMSTEYVCSSGLIP